jgi:hypothetical protein
MAQDQEEQQAFWEAFMKTDEAQEALKSQYKEEYAELAEEYERDVKPKELKKLGEICDARSDPSRNIGSPPAALRLPTPASARRVEALARRRFRFPSTASPAGASVASPRGLGAACLSRGALVTRRRRAPARPCRSCARASARRPSRLVLTPTRQKRHRVASRRAVRSRARGRPPDAALADVDREMRRWLAPLLRYEFVQRILYALLCDCEAHGREFAAQLGAWETRMHLEVFLARRACRARVWVRRGGGVVGWVVVGGGGSDVVGARGGEVGGGVWW